MNESRKMIFKICPSCASPIKRKHGKHSMRKCVYCYAWTCGCCRSGLLCVDCFVKTCAPSEINIYHEEKRACEVLL